MKKYTLLTAGAIQFLKADDQIQICPFQQSIPQKSNLGAVSFNPIPCTSQCAHFDYNLTEKTGFVLLTCGGCERKINLHNEPINTLEIIK